LIYIATIHKDGTQLSGYYSDNSHHDVNKKRKQTHEPKRSRHKTKSNRVEKHASALTPNDGSTEEAPASRVVVRRGQRLGRRGRFRALDPQTLGGDLEVSETGCKRGVGVGV
jgi:hypothetical protein